MIIKNNRIIFWVLLTVLVLAGSWYIKFRWDRSMEMTSSHALLIAKTAGDSLNGEMLKQLHAEPEDEGTVAYDSIKKRLENLPKIDSNMQFAYIYALKGGKIYFVADSELATSPDYSPPGQEYTEADAQYFKPFEDGQSLITNPVADRWGTWISILVPMKDAQTGDIRAVFGIDYPAQTWSREAAISAMQAGFTFLTMLMLFFAIVAVINSAKENEKNFRSLFETIDDIIVISDKSGKILYSNTAAWRKLGYDQSDFKKMSTLDLRPKNRRREAEQLFKDVLSGKTTTCSLPLERRDGILIPAETRIWFGKWYGAECIFCISKDLSAEEEALRKFNKIFESNPNLMAVSMMPKGKFSDVNDTFLEKLGYSKNDLTGKTPKELNIFYPSETYDSAMKAIAEKGSVHDIELQVRKKEGQLMWGVLSGEIIEVSGKKYLLTVIADQTEIKSSRAAVEKLAAIVEDAEEAIIAEDLEGNIISWNKGAQKLYGYQENEVIGKSIKMIVPQDRHKEVDDIIRTIREGKSIEHYSTVRIKKDGSLVDVSISLAPVKGQGDKIEGISVIGMDITKEKQIDRAKTEFVSLASHQLRTPLSAIGWYAEMLLAGDAGKILPKQKKFLAEIYNANKRMVDLVNSLLNVSRIELGTFAVEPQMSDIKEIADIVLSELNPQAKMKKIKISRSYDKEIDKINVDPRLMRIIFQNLLSNAVKYTPTGGKVALSIGRNDGFIKIKVEDTGYGIPKDAWHKIFGKLYRADNVREKETDGTGLGLYVVKSILDQSGGKIGFSSEIDKGTVFEAILPLDGMKPKKGNKGLQ